VLSTLLLLLLTMLDFGLAVLQFNTLSAAARRTVREAVVRGEKAAPERPSWGPDEYTGDAADATEQAEFVRSSLTVMDPEDVAIHMEWPDGDNRIDSRVRVTLRYRYEPILPLPFAAEFYDLSAVSTRTITH